MINHEHYTYRVIWSEEDQEFAGLVAEFPSLSYLHEKQTNALRGIVDLVADIVADMTTNGEALPEPLSEKHYSGKLSLRLTPELHQKLAIQAQEENISLNRYIIGNLITN